MRKSANTPDRATLPAPWSAAALDSSWPRRVVVGTHGGPSADAAVSVAQTFADRPGTVVQFEIGDPVTAILIAAADCNADIIVVGVGRPSPEYRRLGDGIAPSIARLTNVPLYVAARSSHAPASRCVVVFPNGNVHGPTLAVALRCVAAGASVWLAFPDRTSVPADEEALRSAPEIVEHAIGHDAHVSTLDVRRVEIDDDMLTGTLNLAEDVHADLIAIPLQGEPGVERTFLPNLAEPLLGTALCSILAVPGGWNATRSRWRSSPVPPTAE